MPNASSSAAIWSLSSTERLSPSLCVPSRSVVSNRKTSVASGTRHLLVALGPERLELRELAVDHRRERSARQRLHGLEAVAGDQQHHPPAVGERARSGQPLRRRDHRPARRLREQPLGLGQQPDGLEHFAVAGVLGLTGRSCSSPCFQAPAIGAQPSGCAPCSANGSSGTSRRSASSLKAFSTLLISDPPAIGATTWPGSRQPPCSASSKPTVFDPSP